MSDINIKQLQDAEVDPKLFESIKTDLNSF